MNWISTAIGAVIFFMLAFSLRYSFATDGYAKLVLHMVYGVMFAAACICALHGIGVI